MTSRGLCAAVHASGRLKQQLKPQRVVDRFKVEITTLGGWAPKEQVEKHGAKLSLTTNQ
jgi:hypothetical protein